MCPARSRTSQGRAVPFRPRTGVFFSVCWGSGGIGLLAALKMRCPQGRRGSSPLSPTTPFLDNIRRRPVTLSLAWGCSSVGRAQGWQSWGQGFESPQLHQLDRYFLQPRSPVNNVPLLENLGGDLAVVAGRRVTLGAFPSRWGGRSEHIVASWPFWAKEDQHPTHLTRRRPSTPGTRRAPGLTSRFRVPVDAHQGVSPSDATSSSGTPSKAGRNARDSSAASRCLGAGPSEAATSGLGSGRLSAR